MFIILRAVPEISTAPPTPPEKALSFFYYDGPILQTFNYKGCPLLEKSKIVGGCILPQSKIVVCGAKKL